MKRPAAKLLLFAWLLGTVIAPAAVAAEPPDAHAEPVPSPGARGPSQTAPVPSSRSTLLRSSDGRYVFPVAAPVRLLSWTRAHWDGNGAVDIEAAPMLDPRSEAYRAVTHAPVVAVIDGIARPADNLRGGTAVILQGNDGNQYYYAHLRARKIEEQRPVRAGEQLGTVGNSGRWTKYLEPHLHFAIVSRHTEGLEWENDKQASRWLRDQFGLMWRPGPGTGYEEDSPSGWPFVRPGEIVADFAETRRENPDLAGLRLRPASDSGDAPQSEPHVTVISPMTGEVNVIRATVLGLRVQVTNRKTNSSTIFSGLARATVTDGQTVTAGQRLGFLACGETLFYHYFRDDRLRDPEPTLGSVSPLFD